jgi:hypothetical protein
MAKRPTEEELGIIPTAEEIATQSARPVDDNDTPILTADDDDGSTVVHPNDAMTDQEAAEGRVRGPDGKFVTKKADGAEGDAPVADAPAGADKPRAEVPPPGFVSKEALRESRDENKRLMERMTVLLEMGQRREAKAEAALTPKAEPIVVPDKLVDPLGHYDHKLESVEQRIARFEQAEQQTAQQREAAAREEQEIQQVFATARPQFEEAAAANPAIMPTYERRQI